MPARPPSPFIPVAEALGRITTFTVLVPDWLPTDGWRRLPFCACNDDDDGLFPPFVVLTYRRTDRRRRPGEAQQNVTIYQTARVDAHRIFHGLPDDDTWQETAAGVKVTPGGKWYQGQAAHSTRDGTFAYLTSKGITIDDLVRIAASLRPTPETGAA